MIINNKKTSEKQSKEVKNNQKKCSVSLKNSRNSQMFFQFIADVAAIWFGFALQMYVRFFSGLIDIKALPNLTDYVFGAALMTLFWCIIFFFGGLYKNWQIKSPFSEFFAVLKTTFFGCIVIVFFVLSDEIGEFRALFLLYFGIMAFSFTVFRYLARRLQTLLRSRKIIKIPAIIIGNVKRIIDFYDATVQNSWGYEVIGIVLFNPPDKNELLLLESRGIATLYLGTVSDIITVSRFNSIVREKNPEEVIFTAGTPNSKTLFEIESLCTENKIRVLIEPNLYDHFTGRSKAQNIYGIPLIEVSSRIMKPLHAIIKRLFDIVFSFLVIVVGSPIWLLLALLIKLDSRGNVFYSQPRVGRNNRIFTMYKFRSMSQDKCADADHLTWTEVNDPRVTRVGRVIRKTHLDEIPQFYNVLIGDMSTIGPRPEMPNFVEEFSSQLIYYNRRHTVRPGITGWWQVKYKVIVLGLDEVKNRTKDDFYYIENMSLQLDFEILVRTVWCVLRGQGQA